MNNIIKDIEKIIKVKFNNKDLLFKSFIHKSYNKEKNNEKLEFLGDRVIGLIISKPGSPSSFKLYRYIIFSLSIFPLKLTF